MWPASKGCSRDFGTGNFEGQKLKTETLKADIMSSANYPHFHTMPAPDAAPVPQPIAARRRLPKAALGYIRGHEVFGRFQESLLRTLVYDAQTWQILEGRVLPVHCAHYLNVGRNTLARRWLAEMPAEVEVFVSLDTDHVFTPEQVMHLISLVSLPERPIVSGLYFACDDNGAQVRPVLLKRRNDFRLETLWDYPKDALVEVDVVGMGFCAIHRTVLEQLAEHGEGEGFDFDETPNGAFMPEDNAFCFAAQHFLGAKIHVHTGIVVGHMKTVCLTDADMRRNK